MLIFEQISTSLAKILQNDPEIEIFLYIDKWINGKFSILGSSDQKCRFFTNKPTLQNFSDFQISI